MIEERIPPLPKSYDGNFFNGPLPMKRILKRTSLSSGAGGQHVQKIQSRVTLSFEVDDADWLPLWIRERLRMMYGNRINNNGELMVSCDTDRSSIKNTELAGKKLLDMITAASELPDNPYKDTVKEAKRVKHARDRKRKSSLRHQKYKEERLAKYAVGIEMAEAAKKDKLESKSGKNSATEDTDARLDTE